MKQKTEIKLFAVFLMLAVFVLPGFVPAVTTAQTDDLGTQCAAISDSNTGCPDISSADCKVLLQKCADYYDQQSAQLAQDLTKTSTQKNTLQNAITKLKKKISIISPSVPNATKKDFFPSAGIKNRITVKCSILLLQLFYWRVRSA